MGMNMAKMQEMEEQSRRTIIWYSDGAASTVAGMLTLKTTPSAIPVYTATNSEHPDNVRYRSEVEEKLFGKKVIILQSEKYHDIWDVFDKTRWLVGVAGARCTTELKKKMRQQFERPNDIQVFGYTIEEQNRVERFVKNNPEIKVSTPLIDKGLSKEDCLEIIRQHDIELPMLYRLGYKNNNCIPCVKGQSGYYNKIRKDFPEAFDRMAKVERELDVAINKTYAGDGERKRVFLDELPEDMGRYETEPSVSCGLFCGQYLEDETV